MSNHRTLTALSMGIREYTRMPVLLALMAFLPAYIIYAWAAFIPDDVLRVALPGAGLTQVSMVTIYVAMFTPMVAGLVAGVAGLFLMRATRDADSRLVIAGYRPREVLTARFGLLALISLFVTGVSVGVTVVTPFEAEHLGWFVVATLLAALTYGLIGVLAGLVLDRLAGVFLILFGSMIDMYIFQNPLAGEQADIAAYLPGDAPIELAVRAGFTNVDLATVAPGIAYLAVLAALALLAFYRSTRPA